MSCEAVQWLEVPRAGGPRWAVRLGAFVFSSWQLALARPYDWARGSLNTREVILVDYAGMSVSAGEVWKDPFDTRHVTSTGTGEIAFPPGQPIKPSSFAADAADVVSRFHEAQGAPADQLLASLLEFDRRPVHLTPVQKRIRCGIVTALLHHGARQRGLTIANLLSEHFRTPVCDVIPVNGLVATRDVLTARAETRALIETGFSTLKVKLHGVPSQDVALLRAVREVAPGAALRIDPNQSWEEVQALRTLEAVGESEIDYVEDPLPAHATIEDYAEFCRKTPVAVALDAPAASLELVDRIIEARAAHVLVLKPQRVGGLDATFLAAQRATQAGLRVTLTGSLESAVGTCANLQLAAVLPEPRAACGLGTSMFFRQDFAPMPAARGGAYQLSDLPTRFSFPGS